jgi:hypothetical protein
MRVKLSDQSCTALGAVGRKTRRVGRVASSLDLYAQVLSRSVRMPSMQNFHELSAGDSDALEAVNTHGSAQNPRENVKAVNHILGAPSFSPYRSGVI